MHFFLFRPLPHVTGNPPWFLRLVRVSTSSEIYSDTWLFLVFFECIGIQFFNSLTCDLRMPCHARGHLHSLTCDLRTPCHARGHLHSHSYLGKQGISLGVTIILSMCLWLQPIHYNSRFRFMHVNIGKLLLVVKTLIKKIQSSSHINQQSQALK